MKLQVEENTIFIAEVDGARSSATYILDNIDNPDLKFLRFKYYLLRKLNVYLSL